MTDGLTDLKRVDVQVLLLPETGVQGAPDPGMISSTLSPDVMAIARRQASDDRALLARLISEGRAVRRDGDYERRHPEVARRFVREVEGLVRPRVNLAIRSKSKKRKR